MSYFYCSKCSGTFDPAFTYCPVCEDVSLIEQLQAKVAELEEENARLKAESRDASLGLNDYYGRKLAAEQLNNKLLREALEVVIKVHGYESGIPVEALAQPSDTSALDVYVAEKVNKIESCRDWYKRRIDLLQEWQSKMRDPERTIVCDIIANGLTMPEGGRYEIGKSDLSTITKQRDLADKAMREALECGEDGDWQSARRILASAIKESEK